MFAVFVFALCLATSGASGAQAVMLATNQGEGPIIVDDSRVYWINVWDGSVRSVDKINGGPVRIHSQGPDASASDLAQDNVSIYFIGSENGLASGHVYAAAKAFPATVTQLFQDDPSYPEGIAISGGSLFYYGYTNVQAENGGVCSLSVQGGTPTVVDMTWDGGPNGFGFKEYPTSFSVDNVDVYWIDTLNKTIRHIPFVGGLETTDVTGLNNPEEILTPTQGPEGGSIFWLENPGSGQCVLKRRKVGGEVITVLTNVATGNSYRNFAVYNGMVCTVQGVQLVKVSIDGGTPTELGTILDTFGPMSVAVDSSYVYWTAVDGSVRRINHGIQMPVGWAAITVLANPADGGTVSGGGSIYPVGSQLLISVSHTNSGWTFTGWNDGSTVNPRTITVPSGGATYTANFQQMATITVTANPSNGGTVSGGGTYPVGSQVQISVSHTNSGWTFAGWNDGSTVNPRTITVPSGGATYTANFQQMATITVTANPSNGGAVSGGDTYPVGSQVQISASTNSGWTFTGWNDGPTTTPRTITVPSGGATYIANFADRAKPTNTITTPTPGLRVSKPSYTATGKSGDNALVSNVRFQINWSDWTNASTTNGWTNWSAGVTLVPGTNTIAAYAVDTSGNLSVTSSVSFQFVVTNQLGVRTVGLGTILPNYSNAWPEVGRNYSITSSPASGFIFTNWTVSTNWIGGTVVTGTNLQFMMQSNLTLQANFVDVTRPTNTITAPTTGQHMTNALATVVGTARDNWKVSGVWCQLNSGAWMPATTTNGYTNWTATVTLLVGTNTVNVCALDLGGNCSATNSLNVVSSNTFKLQLSFTLPKPLATNGLNFMLQISSNLNGHIQTSTNLLNWVTLTNFVGTNTTLNFRDATATNFNQHFYRAVIP